MTVKDLFIACLEAEDAERARLLRDADPALREEAARLLAAHGEADALFEPRVPQAAPVDLRRRLGEFLIGDVIGEGGMGVVYRARQEHPRREVALKILPSHRVRGLQLARFEAEADALARLEHAAITRIHAAGALEDGDARVPYIAMELVDGETLDAWAVDGRTLEERLELLAGICDGVHYAHERGVIHRDLKPSNVLVDRGGAPRILDFGVARVLGSDRGLTRAGEIVGTLAYMSPEQARGDEGDVDTRSDQYSLGAIAYELFTGRVPVEVDGKPITEAARAIVETRPPLPSAHAPGLPREIDAVVGKALSKRREDRYASVAELAADLGRILAGEPVSARPPGLAQSLGRLVRRHRVAAGAAFLVAAGGLAAIVALGRANRDLVGAEGQARRNLERSEEALDLAEKRRLELERLNLRLEESLLAAGKAKEDAEGARARAEFARSDAEAARDDAWRDRERALGIEQVWRTFLLGGSQGMVIDPDTRLEDLVDDFVGRLGVAANGSPAGLGAARAAAAEMLQRFERLDDALDQVDLAIAEFARESEGASDYAVVAMIDARILRAEILLKAYGDAAADVELSTCLDLAESLAPDLADTMQLRVLSERCGLLLDLRREADARDAWEEAIEIVEDDIEAAADDDPAVLLRLGATARELGETAKAVELLEYALERAGSFSAHRGYVVLAEVHLAQLEEDRGALAEAERHAAAAVRMLSDEVNSPRLRATAREVLAVIVSKRGRHEKARALFDEVLALHAVIADPAWRARSLTNRAICLQSCGDSAGSRDDAKAAIALLRGLDMKRDVGLQLDAALNALFFALVKLDDTEGALAAMNECRSLRRELHGEKSRTFLHCEYNRGCMLARLDRHEESLALLRSLEERLRETPVESLAKVVPERIAEVEKLAATADD